MRIHPASSAALRTPSLLARDLPSQIVERAAGGLFWVSLIAVISAAALTLTDYLLHPGFAEAWAHPVLRLAFLALLLLSAGFIAVQRAGCFSKRQLLNLGMVFQVAVAFHAVLSEAAAYQDADTVVFGVSRVAIWMLLCAWLAPNAPLKSAVTAALCVAMWPLGYWVDLQIFGYQPMTFRGILVWILPLVVTATCVYAINSRMIAFCVRQQRCEDVGSYTLTSQLGKGGMGEVWRAKHNMLARDAAVKLIRPEVLNASSGQQEFLIRRRFEREAQVTASLRCPHTVALYDFGQTNEGAFYYVMELLDGIDLETMVNRCGPMHPARVVHILRQVSQSLEEAHHAGLVHRDIKPRNILLAKQGLECDFAKVLDFGLVKATQSGDSDRTLTTVDGVIAGTPAFLSPEAAMGNRSVDARSDLYSLGCTAYFLLTGQLVFDVPSPTAFLIAHVQTTPIPVSQRAELPIPAELEAIVMQLLEKDPLHRIQSARELRRRLRLLPQANDWCPERAERWWEINWPNLAALTPAIGTASVVTPATLAA